VWPCAALLYARVIPPAPYVSQLISRFRPEQNAARPVGLSRPVLRPFFNRVFVWPAAGVSSPLSPTPCLPGREESVSLPLHCTGPSLSSNAATSWMCRMGLSLVSSFEAPVEGGGSLHREHFATDGYISARLGRRQLGA